jgi:hypothetical protein
MRHHTCSRIALTLTLCMLGLGRVWTCPHATGNGERLCDFCRAGLAPIRLPSQSKRRKRA